MVNEINRTNILINYLAYQQKFVVYGEILRDIGMIEEELEKNELYDLWKWGDETKGDLNLLYDINVLRSRKINLRFDSYKGTGETKLEFYKAKVKDIAMGKKIVNENLDNNTKRILKRTIENLIQKQKKYYLSFLFNLK